MTSVVSAQGVDLTFQTADGPVQALRDVNLQVGKGDFVSFIGPSGCGKTTFLRCVAALETPTGGALTVNGMSPEEARKARTYGYVFQAAGLYPWRTIGRNVTLPLEIMGLFAGRPRNANEERSATRGSCRVREQVPLAAVRRDAAAGQHRPALAFDAEILLMDEPFGALDEIVRDHLNEELLKLWAQTKKTCLFVTHSIPEAVYLSTKIVVMSPRPGRITDIIDSPLPAERPLEIRDTPAFIEIAHRVRDGLRAGHGDEV